MLRQLRKRINTGEQGFSLIELLVSFSIEKDSDGNISRTCSDLGEGGCDSGGEW